MKKNCRKKLLFIFNVGIYIMQNNRPIGKKSAGKKYKGTRKKGEKKLEKKT